MLMMATSYLAPSSAIVDADYGHRVAMYRRSVCRRIIAGFARRSYLLMAFPSSHDGRRRCWGGGDDAIAKMTAWRDEQ